MADPTEYSMVTTSRTKYFGRVKDTAFGIEVEDAYELTAQDNTMSNLAKNYMRAKLQGDTRRMELRNGLIESVTEVPETSLLIKTYTALIPNAEKRAMGSMTYQGLEQLLTK